MRVVVMWVVKTINRDNITDIVEYVQEISKINDKDITLSLNSIACLASTCLSSVESIENFFIKSFCVIMLLVDFY